MKNIQYNAKFGIWSSIPLAVISIFVFSFCYIIPLWFFDSFFDNENYIYFGIVIGFFLSFPFFSVFWASANMANEDWQNLFGLHHIRKRSRHCVRDEIARLVGLDDGVSK